ncbi:C4-dicarboxylate transporter DctA [Sphingobacterium wenxiniae]|uniref:Aerobic C4-dicarboxylate transport protein n=1 Tax=Sphingobacterium wenxiniae TaxID=683125 RepID=A0A1I6VJL0_9SPHI|nr:C4-dicarboxylate transporter DctA [Sphingobacterium wenxiniae]SFT13936.1 aerobic C4-dicarboxylate transport protein [Sphingobacterium wenxiniae]
MKKLFSTLYFQVIVAIIIGATLGHFYPDLGVSLKPFGDGFIKLIKMIIAPLIFCSIVLGIAGMEDVKKVGRLGMRSMIYFQVTTFVAMFIALAVINLAKPGVGMNIDPSSLDTSEVTSYIEKGKEKKGVVQFLLDIIPNNIIGSLSEGNILQVLFFAILLGFAFSKMGQGAEPVKRVLQSFLDGLFLVIKMIMKVAPIGAMGAIGFTVGKYGLGILKSLGLMMFWFYVACLIYIFIFLGILLWRYKISLWQFLGYIKEELLIVLGTSSSESVLPAIMEKLERAGCSKSTVRLVIPTGYSFNLDGTAIYLTMASVFLAQAINHPMGLSEQLFLLFVLTFTSNGAAGVTGSGFIILAATLPIVGHIPVESIAIVFGIDRFMSEARALTNIIGNASAALILAKTENELDMEQLNYVLNKKTIQ